MKRMIFTLTIMAFGFGFTACADESEEIVPQQNDVVYTTEGGGGEKAGSRED